MSGTDFLTFLVDETLKLQKKGEAKLSSLELKLTDYKLDFIRGEFVPQSQMLRFRSTFGVFDIPVNWSIFSAEEFSQYCVLSEKDDHDCLFKVLQTAWDPRFTKILITHSDGFCYLVGLQAGDESHLRDLITHQENYKAA